jgi:hypothetical protein
MGETKAQTAFKGTIYNNFIVPHAMCREECGKEDLWLSEREKRKPLKEKNSFIKQFPSFLSIFVFHFVYTTSPNVVHFKESE